MPENGVKCWKCDLELGELLLPLSRTEECSNCGRDLHVCRMCKFYDTRVNNACKEPVAEFVSDKTRANFCGYLELAHSADPRPALDNLPAAFDDLNDLFGLPNNPSDQTDPVTQLQDLFDIDDPSE